MKYTCSNSNRDAGGAALGLTTDMSWGDMSWKVTCRLSNL